jgi:pimeloyl-ACP methyl ester carboxylesterase
LLKRTPATLDLWDMVKFISTPTLLQYGSHSNVVSPELAERLKQTMPQCTVERIENAGHALFTDQPDAFAASVERFLRGWSLSFGPPFTFRTADLRIAVVGGSALQLPRWPRC